ncbi:MAG: riboflavin synthase [Candidatus Brocadiaceae bacterium]|nr:riboflavin synthase [Candidatus Brocadiaceae bacterium]
MFTGIVEHLAVVKKLSLKAGGAELLLGIEGLYHDIELGESIAINGVCLTVKNCTGDTASFDVSGETLKKTTLGTVRNAEKVNVERALRVGDRLGGHFVTGHIDGMGTIKEKRPSAKQCTIYFSAEKRFTDMMIEKGSVAVDGISLTIVDVTHTTFSIAVIPFTLATTTLEFKKNGDPVNIEIDMMGKWIKRLMENTRQGTGTHITREYLSEQGFQ